jgi:FkbM family methyltransferase
MGVRALMSQALLRAPAPLRSLRNIPVLGQIFHALSHTLVKADDKIWVPVQSGPAQGLQLELNPRTGQSYAKGDTELVVQEFLASHLKPGDVFYDLGANIGLFTLIGARCVGPTGKVFSFEPDPEVSARLRRNVARNNFANVSIIESGVWSSTTALPFAASPATSPDRGFGTFVGSSASGSDSFIPCVSIDDFARLHPAPTAIKCDVEFAEIEVLKGALVTFENCRPWILGEMHSPENDREARAILSQFGYRLENVDDVHLFASP